MMRGVTPLHIVQHLLLVDVDQYAALNGIPQSRALYSTRLKANIAVEQDDRRTPLPKMSDGFQRTRV